MKKTSQNRLDNFLKLYKNADADQNLICTNEENAIKVAQKLIRVRKLIALKKTISASACGFLIMLSATHARADTFSADVPAYGCYKNNGADQCVETTYLICADDLAENVAQFGPIIGSFCDDLNYYDQQLGAQNWKILKLKQRIKNLTNKLKKIKGKQ